MLENFAKLERYILEHIPDESLHITYKQLNDNAVHDGINTSTEKKIRTLLYFLAVKGYAHKKEDGVRNLIVTRDKDIETIIKRFERRIEDTFWNISRMNRCISHTNNSMTMPYTTASTLQPKRKSAHCYTSWQ